MKIFLRIIKFNLSAKKNYKSKCSVLINIGYHTFVCCC